MVPVTTKDLGIHESQIYDWHNMFQQKKSTSQREAELAAEVAKLKRQLAEQSEDLAILKRLPPTSRRIKNKAVQIR